MVHTYYISSELMHMVVNMKRVRSRGEKSKVKRQNIKTSEPHNNQEWCFNVPNFQSSVCNRGNY